MATNKINEATTVASSRSRGGKKKQDKTKQQQGTAQEKIISISTDKDTNAFSDFAQFLEQQLNEHIQKEIKKKIN